MVTWTAVLIECGHHAFASEECDGLDYLGVRNEGAQGFLVRTHAMSRLRRPEQLFLGLMSI